MLDGVPLGLCLYKYQCNRPFEIDSRIPLLPISPSSSSPLLFLFLHGIRASDRAEFLIMASTSSADEQQREEERAVILPMPTTPHLTGFHLPIKLTRENFLLWKTQLLPLLNCYDLAHILTQEPPISTQLDSQGKISVNPTYQAWWRQDQQVLTLIVSSLSESVLPCVIGKVTARDAWEALLKNCSSTNPSRIMHLHNRLHHGLRGDKTIEDYVQEIRRTCDELAAAGHPVQETVTTYALLRGLGPTYSAFTAGITLNLAHLGFADVVAQIQSHDELMKSYAPSKENLSADFPPAANQAQLNSNDRGKGNRGRGNRGRGKNGGRNAPRCQLCGVFGHRVQDCRERFNRSF